MFKKKKFKLNRNQMIRQTIKKNILNLKLNKVMLIFFQYFLFYLK